MYPKSHSFKWQKVPEPRLSDVMAATLNHMTSIFKGWKSVPIKNNAKQPKRHRFQKHSKSGLTSLEELSASSQLVFIKAQWIVPSSAEERYQMPTPTGIHRITGNSIQNGNIGPSFTSKLPLLKSHASIVMPPEYRAMHTPGNSVTVLHPTWFTSYLINSHNFLASGKKELIFFAFPDQGSSHIFIAVLYYAKKKIPNIHLPQFRNSDTWWS